MEEIFEDLSRVCFVEHNALPGLTNRPETAMGFSAWTSDGHCYQFVVEGQDDCRLFVWKFLNDRPFWEVGDGTLVVSIPWLEDYHPGVSDLEKVTGCRFDAQPVTVSGPYSYPIAF